MRKCTDAARVSLVLLCSMCALADGQPPAGGFSDRAKDLVSRMTLDEKALLLSGDGWWRTHAIERLGVPSVYMTDGPNGLRKSQGAGLAPPVKATCFPTASALAATWNADLVREVGAAIGQECQANDVQILLAPGVNMKRSPLGGRNFEYYSEDPLVAGKLSAAFINGVQSQGVGTSLKHFAANSQEFERMATSSDVDERTLREIYLPAFETAIAEAKPWTVMCAYNKVNGTPASRHAGLLTDVLRHDWAFDGFVVSDWGAVDDRVKGLAAGLDLEMPGSGEVGRKKILEAIHDGTLPERTVDEAARRVLAVVLRAHAAKRSGASFDADEHHALARRAAGESLVLLKNAHQILPLHLGSAASHGAAPKIALIGAFAKTPRYQGAGSSQVNPARLAVVYDELQKLAGRNATLTYAAGYDAEGATTTALLSEAKTAARSADLAIVFAGVPDSAESEGFDRASLDLPAGHTALIDTVARNQKHVVVVLMNGSAVTMPWLPKVDGVLEAWLSGQAGGGAIADVLMGRVNPSGKLAETFAARIDDTPTALDFPARGQHARYGEGVFIGYRSYDRKKIVPLFPFGYGLSYTTFRYSHLKLSRATLGEGQTVDARFDLTNTGARAGQEVAQVYVGEDAPLVSRPPRELKGFAKIALQPGETKTVALRLYERAFAHYDVESRAWIASPGHYRVFVGGSSRDLPLVAALKLDEAPSRRPRRTLTRESMIKEFREHPRGRAFYAELIGALHLLPEPPSPGQTPPEETPERKKSNASILVFLSDMPVGKLVAFSEGKFSEKRLQEILDESNH